MSEQQPQQPQLTPEVAKAVVEAIDKGSHCPTCGQPLEKSIFREENIWRMIGLPLAAFGLFLVPANQGIALYGQFISYSGIVICLGLAMFGWPVVKELSARFGKR